MPKKSDFSKAVIYKIKCLDPYIKDIYVGSTCNFIKRKSDHKSTCNNPNSKDHNIYVYQFIREQGGWDNWKMVMVKQSPCNSRIELNMLEEEVIQEFQDLTTLNSVKAYTTIDERKEQMKKWNKENPDKCSVYSSEYRKRKPEKQKEYEEKNKEKIEERKGSKISCVCGSSFRRDSKARHIKTKKHIDWVKSQEEEKD